MADHIRLHRRRFVWGNAAALLGVFSVGKAEQNSDNGEISGQEPRPADSLGRDTIDVNQELSVPSRGVPTLGGRQFWGDLSYLRGWKIQRNVFTGHCRLLSPEEYRFASGSLEHCRNVLHRIQQQRQLQADTGKAVILLHGIGRSSHCFSKMMQALKANDYTVVPFEYPSTRIPLEQSSQYLQSVINSLGDVSSIDFVTHSMGGLVVRTLLKEFSDPRLHSLVMLGTPNYGAELADMLHRTKLFSLIFGPAGQQLITGETAPPGQLPVPSIPFGVIAGGKGSAGGFNPLLPGDDDGTVTVDSARLKGAADFLLVPRLHSFLMADPTVIEATLCFLSSGRFNLSRPAQPITAEPVSAGPPAADIPSDNRTH